MRLKIHRYVLLLNSESAMAQANLTLKGNGPFDGPIHLNEPSEKCLWGVFVVSVEIKSMDRK